MNEENYYSDKDLDNLVELAGVAKENYTKTEVREILQEIDFNDTQIETAISQFKKQPVVSQPIVLKEETRELEEQAKREISTAKAINKQSNYLVAFSLLLLILTALVVKFENIIESNLFVINHVKQILSSSFECFSFITGFVSIIILAIAIVWKNRTSVNYLLSLITSFIIFKLCYFLLF